VRGAEPTQFALDRGDLAVQVVDQRDRREHGGAPRLGKVQAREQFPAGRTEPIADRAGARSSSAPNAHGA
jgi:hypothetical protein